MKGGIQYCLNVLWAFKVRHREHFTRIVHARTRKVVVYTYEMTKTIHVSLHVLITDIYVYKSGTIQSLEWDHTEHDAS